MDNVSKGKEELKKVRVEIDEIDSKLLPLLIERMGCSKKVAEIKSKYQLPVLNSTREQEILDSVRSKSGELGEFTTELYKDIMSVSRAYQNSLLKRNSAVSQIVESSLTSFKENPKIFCQGVAGAYSHRAASAFFGKESDINFCQSFADVFEKIADGEGDYGVVPLENSNAGSVSEVYGLLIKYKFFLVGGVNVSISHNLAAKTTDITKISKVISHDQALMQCKKYIKDQGFTAISFSNTAAAAKAVSETEDETIAAICSKEAAEKYGLNILGENIQDNKYNHTRFAVFSKTPVTQEGADKISLCFNLPNRPGALAEILTRLASKGINLCKIESRPIAGTEFEYVFYTDCTGSVREKEMLSALDYLNSEVEAFTYLGNYKEIMG